MQRLFRVVSLVAITILLSSCYLTRATYEQSKILLNRVPIQEVITEQKLPSEQLEKLRLVIDARAFAESIGLTPKGSFTQFTAVDRDILAWVVMGSKPDAFELYTWWFPIVGTVPYKGYFSEEDAQSAARALESNGYESWVRGTDAMSTLGWFDDPVLSTIFKGDEIEIANTVIHESLHSTVWIKNSVDFNESLANYIGRQGAVEFFVRRAEASPSPENLALKERACMALKAELEFAAGMDRLYTALAALYKSERTQEQKLAEREQIFNTEIAPLRAAFPRMKILQRPNNAEIMQLRIYLTDLQLFRRAFDAHSRDWPRFLAMIRKLAAEEPAAPFELLRDQLGSSSKSELEKPVC